MKIKFFFFIICTLFIFITSVYSSDNKNKLLEVYKNLRCLVCQGQSIADSNSDFAQTVKLVVKDLIKDGKTEREIYTFMADKYGDWIVFKPQVNKQNFILWFLPYLALILGGVIIFFLFKKRRNS